MHSSGGEQNSISAFGGALHVTERSTLQATVVIGSC